jgi:hypothetical protein
MERRRLSKMFILYHTGKPDFVAKALAVSHGIDPLWQAVVARDHSTKDKRTLRRFSTRDDFAGGEEIILDLCSYQIARIDVV